jgi:hypothetical protein
MDSLPKMDLYVPAEHDEFVQIAYNKKYINEIDILSVDCDIINRCDLLIIFGDASTSIGMQTELKFAEKNNIPIYFMPKLDKATIDSLKFAIQLVLKG